MVARKTKKQPPLREGCFFSELTAKAYSPFTSKVMSRLTSLCSFTVAV